VSGEAVVEGLAEHLAPATVRTDYGVLRAVLSAAVNADLLAVSPCRRVSLPAHTRKEIRYLSADELERLASKMPEAYRPTVYLAGVLELRWSEVGGPSCQSDRLRAREAGDQRDVRRGRRQERLRRRA
jgi:integrase